MNRSIDVLYSSISQVHPVGVITYGGLDSPYLNQTIIHKIVWAPESNKNCTGVPLTYPFARSKSLGPNTVRERTSTITKMMCIDLKDIRNLTFMVCNFCFVFMLFPLELSTLFFCMTLPFVEYAKRMLSLIIAIHEFVGCLAFPSEFWILIVQYPVIVRIGNAIDKTSY